MTNSEFEKSNVPNESSGENICDLKYLTEMMGGKNKLIKEIIDVFLQQVPQELKSIKDAISITDFAVIKNFAHTMKSSVSIMGISLLTPILQEMEDLGTNADDIEKIKELNEKLTLICKQAIEEIEREKINYA